MNTNKHLTPNTPSTITNTPSTTPNTPASIGERIRALRKKRGISQQVLGDFIGVDKATVSRWENCKGEPSLYDIRRLADYFEVSDVYITHGPVEAQSDLLDLSGIPYYSRSLLVKLAEVLRD